MIGTTKYRPVKVFKPLPWQVPFWRDRSPVLLATGSAGGGKSHIALEKINGFCLKYPKAFALISRKVKVSMTSGTALFFEDAVTLDWAESIMSGARHLKSASRFEYKNGSMAAYMGLEDERQLSRLRSIGLAGGVDIGLMEEGTEYVEKDFNAFRARMRGTAAPWRQLMLATNPDAPTHWINRRLIIGGEASVHISHARDNPHNPDDYQDTLNSLTGVDYLRLAKGLWVQATGLVYENWLDTPAGNVTNDADYRPGDRVYWAVDDGYTGSIDKSTQTFKAGSHPRVILFAQIRPNGELCVFEELYQIKTEPEEHLQDALDLGYPLPEFAAVDKSAAQLKGRMQRMGLYTQNGPGSVAESVKEMRTWVSPEKKDDPTSFRRVKVHPRCRHLRLEMVSYTNGPNDKPIKDFDHGPDALRYLIWRLRYE